MCGIVGYCGNSELDKPSLVLKKMLTRIQHRGPDESGIYMSDEVGLGSVRLSIIDLKSGTMPISNQDESLWIVFNGEVYNFPELRQELVSKGYKFKTKSDTEVIVNLYQEYGSSCLSRLNGQFAIAIWDKESKNLFLARDRVGIRPLYYTVLSETLIFGSEIKSLLEYPGVELKISPQALQEYFTFWTPLDNKSIFENVLEVPPGSFLEFKDGVASVQNYWKLPINTDKKELIEDPEIAAQTFEDLFSDAIRIRLRADVQVAAYLSGGIDSSVTTAFIKNFDSEVLNTFSIGFEDKDFDETHYQNLAASFFKTDHKELICSSKEISDNFENVVWHCEAPILRTSPVPMSLLASFVRNNNIKVVITGEGADELLGGYNIFKEAKIRRFWAKDPNSKLRPLLLRKLYPYLPHLKTAKSNVLKMFFGYKLNDTESVVYSHLLRWSNTSRIKNYLSKNILDSLEGYSPEQNYEFSLKKKLKNAEDLIKAQYIEIDLFLSKYLLSSQGDRMGMAHSVEGRYPFLDHRIIEFCMKLSPDLKLRGLNEKYLLKKMIRGKIPDEILFRHKQAYRAPIKNVLVSENAPDYLKFMLEENTIRKFGLFDIQRVKKLIQKFKEGDKISEIDNMALTGILSVQILFDKFINKSIPELTEEHLVHLDKMIIEN